MFQIAYGRIPQFSSYSADEQRRPRTEQQRRYVKSQHVDKACAAARRPGTPSIIMSPDLRPWTQIRLGAGTRNMHTPVHRRPQMT